MCTDTRLWVPFQYPGTDTGIVYSHSGVESIQVNLYFFTGICIEQYGNLLTCHSFKE
jgi:hypothetical protein